jgi:hypothetical protein
MQTSKATGVMLHLPVRSIRALVLVHHFGECSWLSFPMPLKFIRQLTKCNEQMDATGMPVMEKAMY